MKAIQVKQLDGGGGGEYCHPEQGKSGDGITNYKTIPSQQEQ